MKARGDGTISAKLVLDVIAERESKGFSESSGCPIKSGMTLSTMLMLGHKLRKNMPLVHSLYDIDGGHGPPYVHVFVTGKRRGKTRPCSRPVCRVGWW